VSLKPTPHPLETNSQAMLREEVDEARSAAEAAAEVAAAEAAARHELVRRNERLGREAGWLW